MALRVTWVPVSTTVEHEPVQSTLPGLAVSPDRSLLVTAPDTVEAVPLSFSLTLTGNRLPPLAGLVERMVVDSSGPTKLAQLFGSLAGTVSEQLAVCASS